MYLIAYHFTYIVLLQLDTCENKIKTIEIDYCVAHTIIAIQFPNKGVNFPIRIYLRKYSVLVTKGKYPSTLNTELIFWRPQ